MVDTVVERATGAENVIWDLSVFYSGADDPAIQRDIDSLNQQAEKFAAEYKGRVASLDAEEMMDALVE